MGNVGEISLFMCLKEKKMLAEASQYQIFSLQILVSASVFKILYQSGSRRHLQPHQRAVSFTRDFLMHQSACITEMLVI